MNQTAEGKNNWRGKVQEIPFGDFIKDYSNCMTMGKYKVVSEKEFDRIISFLNKVIGLDEKGVLWGLLSHEKGSGKVLATCVEIPEYKDFQIFMTYTDVNPVPVK